MDYEDMVYLNRLFTEGHSRGHINISMRVVSRTLMHITGMPDTIEVSESKDIILESYEYREKEILKDFGDDMIFKIGYLTGAGLGDANESRRIADEIRDILEEDSR